MNDKEKTIKGFLDELTIELGDKLLMDYPQMGELIQGTAIYEALIQTTLREDIDLAPAAALICGELREAGKI